MPGVNWNPSQLLTRPHLDISGNTSRSNRTLVLLLVLKLLLWWGMKQHNYRIASISWSICFLDILQRSVLSCAVLLCAKFREGGDGMRWGPLGLNGQDQDGQKEGAPCVVYRSLSHFWNTCMCVHAHTRTHTPFATVFPSRQEFDHDCVLMLHS